MGLRVSLCFHFFRFVVTSVDLRFRFDFLFGFLLLLLLLFSFEPDADRLAGHDESAGRRPATRHRETDPRHAADVRHQTQLPHIGRVAGQSGSGQLGRPQTRQRRRPRWWFSFLFDCRLCLIL